MTLIYDTIQNYNSYFRPLKPRIRFKSPDAATTYFTFDGFAGGANPVNVIYCDAERAIGETGVFNIIVEDSQNLIDRDKLRNTKVFLDFGKSQSEWKQFLIGYADIFSRRRPRTNYMEYLISGPTTRIQAAELYISRRQASSIQNIDDPTVVPDPRFNLNKLFSDSLTKRGWRPLNKEAIDSGHPNTSWIGDKISSAVNINIPVINEPETTLWEVWDKWCQIAGAVWDIDYSVPDVESVLLSYNPSLHTGILIKSGDLKAITADQTTKVSYIKSNFDVEENSSADAGTATRLYATTIADRQIVASSTGATGGQNLNNRALAQQVIIENDQRRITSLAFVLSKIGDPQSPKDRVNGDICLDSGDNKPTGKVIGVFKIPLSDIDATPKTVFVNDVDVKIRFLEGSNKIWLRLFQRSGITGNPIDDSANTIRWHDNDIFNTPQTLYSANAPKGDYDERDSLIWASAANGPIRSFSILSNIRRLQARTNMQAANRLRMKEAVVDASFLLDPANVSTFMSINLSKRSKARLGVQDVVVTVPNDYMYAPYQWVSFNDGLSTVSQDLQVQRARIVCSALPGDPQIGALDMSITLAGLYNSIIGSCQCA